MMPYSESDEVADSILHHNARPSTIAEARALARKLMPGEDPCGQIIDNVAESLVDRMAKPHQIGI